MNGSQAELKRANLNSAFFKQAYDNHAKVVHVNSFVPSEIVLAMGLVPFNLGAVGGILAQAKAATKLINVAQHHHYSVDLCSTSRCLLGAALQNTLPNPDFLVITSGPCDVGSHIYYILSQMYGRKWFLIDVPAGEADIGDEAVGYLENQLQKLVRVLEETLQIKLDRQCLHQALEFSNQAALYIQKTSSLAQQIPSPLRAEESIELVSCFHLLGCADMAALCGERYEENRRKTLEQPAAKSRKPRILWHGLKPFYTN
jgi:benzoyl-CoA reductase/2-hydroxyglutaryl-CoA dehydratase subunit BcrC/BadD/HgdB